MVDTVTAPSAQPLIPVSNAGVARGGTAITNVAVFLGYMFDCHEGGWHLVTPNQAQESVLALGLIVLWDWIHDILTKRSAVNAANAANGG